MNPDHAVEDIAPLIASLSKPQIILLGAGAAGGYALRHLRSKGIEPLAVVDNSPSKWGLSIKGSTCADGIEGIQIMDPKSAHDKFPDAEWVACAISRPAATEIRAQLNAMGVRTRPLWQCMPVQHGLPPDNVIREIALLLKDDRDGLSEWWSQFKFRSQPDYDRQRAPTDAGEIYFPDWIARREDEVFWDLGGADGDTVREFRKRWKNYARIVAFEPDPINYRKLASSCLDDLRNETINAAVSDHTGTAQFAALGDYSSHLGAGSEEVRCYALDDLELDPPPTYIKFDIEGSELEALWGARRILLDHRPVLAVCAYHQSDHLWQIPLLLHALQPAYKLAFRRYAEGAFELVWYAVPPERVK